jgi:glyoxylase-like metal-dependent hydrolase (beta-lactamase superfamily II)
VAAVINTHAHAEQVLGNGALAAPVMALAGTAQAMQARCPQCLASLTHEMGEPAMHGTRIVLPEQVLHEGQWLQVGGRSWWVQEMQRAHTESDLVLWTPSPGAHANANAPVQAKGGVVLVGGLVDGRWPVLAQGSVLGWLQALDRLRVMQPDWLIGQHLVAGPSQVQPVLQRQHGYLCGILAHAWRRLEQGQSEAEGVQGMMPPATWPTPEPRLVQAWQQQHVFNQRRAWREAEQLWLDRQAWPNTCGSAPDVRR